MKVTSQAHIDQHETLKFLVAAATDAWTQRRTSLQSALEKAEAEVAAFKALPWYKRWFRFVEPCTEHESWQLFAVNRNLEFLEKLSQRMRYDLSIELDDGECNILFYGVL